MVTRCVWMRNIILIIFFETVYLLFIKDTYKFTLSEYGILYLQLLTLHVTGILTSDAVAAMRNNSRHAQIAHRLLEDFGDLEVHW